MKARTAVAFTPQPLWCHRFCSRIAPYDMRTVHQGKNYPRDCYVKLNQEKAQARKN
jgi:hypothetical protein